MDEGRFFRAGSKLRVNRGPKNQSSS